MKRMNEMDNIMGKVLGFPPVGPLSSPCAIAHFA